MTRPISVFLVDDDQEFLEPIARWLETKGYKVTKIYKGEDALEEIKKMCPDIVFLDINMPAGLDGIETLNEIRKISKSLPVVMITAYGTHNRLSKAKEYGISGFFPKDSPLNEMVTLIETVLRKHKSQN